MRLSFEADYGTSVLVKKSEIVPNTKYTYTLLNNGKNLRQAETHVDII